MNTAVRQTYEQVRRDRAQAVQRVEQCDALLASLRALYPDLLADEAVERQPRIVTRGPRSPLVQAVRSVLEAESRWLTVREVADLVRERQVVADDGTLEQNVRAALTRRLPEVERKQKDGRTVIFRAPLTSTEAVPALTETASALPDQPRSGGESTYAQPEHRHHGQDTAEWNNRDHDRGAPVVG